MCTVYIVIYTCTVVVSICNVYRMPKYFLVYFTCMIGALRCIQVVYCPQSCFFFFLKAMCHDVITCNVLSTSFCIHVRSLVVQFYIVRFYWMYVVVHIRFYTIDFKRALTVSRC